MFDISSLVNGVTLQFNTNKHFDDSVKYVAINMYGYDN